MEKLPLPGSRGAQDAVSAQLGCLGSLCKGWLSPGQGESPGQGSALQAFPPAPRLLSQGPTCPQQ